LFFILLCSLCTNVIVAKLSFSKEMMIPSSDCQIVINNTAYDLSPMTRTYGEEDYYFSGVEDYYINICAPCLNTNCQSVNPNSASCIQLHNNIWVNIGVTPAVFSDGMLLYQNGQFGCSGRNRNTKIIFQCDPTTSGQITSVIENPGCTYWVYMNTKYVCSPPPPPPSAIWKLCGLMGYEFLPDQLQTFSGCCSATGSPIPSCAVTYIYTNGSQSQEAEGELQLTPPGTLGNSCAQGQAMISMSQSVGGKTSAQELCASSPLDMPDNYVGTTYASFPSTGLIPSFFFLALNATTLT